MRKLFSLGVLALLLSVLSSPVVAAVEDCETLKGDGGSKGLYGMCVAYWNSVSNHDDGGLQSNRIEDSNRFLDRYNAIRDRVGGPEMPGLSSSSFDCFCWSDVRPEDVGLNAVMKVCSGTPSVFRYLTFFDNQGPFQLFIASTASCAYEDEFGSVFKSFGPEDSRATDCLREIEALCK